MQKSKSSAAAAAPASDAPPSALAVADAMCRAADECCRQHDRVARIVEQSDVETEVTFEDGRKGRIEADLVIRDLPAAPTLDRAA